MKDGPAGTQKHSTKGTLRYMHPSIHTGQYDLQAVDHYATGVLTLDLLEAALRGRFLHDSKMKGRVKKFFNELLPDGGSDWAKNVLRRQRAKKWTHSRGKTDIGPTPLEKELLNSASTSMNKKAMVVCDVCGVPTKPRLVVDGRCESCSKVESSDDTTFVASDSGSDVSDGEKAASVPSNSNKGLNVRENMDFAAMQKELAVLRKEKAGWEKQMALLRQENAALKQN